MKRLWVWALHRACDRYGVTPRDVRFTWKRLDFVLDVLLP